MTNTKKLPSREGERGEEEGKNEEARENERRKKGWKGGRVWEKRKDILVFFLL